MKIMKSIQKRLKRYLPQLFLSILTLFLLTFLLNPIAKMLDVILNDLSDRATKLIVLQLLVGLLIVIFVLIASIFIILKNFNYKKHFRFGVYWHKLKPYCPHCGNKLKETVDYKYLLDCPVCEERICLIEDKNMKHIELKDAIEIVRKEI